MRAMGLPAVEVVVFSQVTMGILQVRHVARPVLLRQSGCGSKGAARVGLCVLTRRK